MLTGTPAVRLVSPLSLVVSLFVLAATARAQIQIDPQPVPLPELPYFDGTVTALGDMQVPAGVLDLADCTTTDQAERARNTYSFALLSPENGWDKALKDLQDAYPGFAGAANVAKIAVIEGNFVLTDPPLSMPLPLGSVDARRIIRGTGGLRVGLVHTGDAEVESESFSHWAEGPRTFLPKAGLIQMAESLAVDQPAKYGFLANLLPPEAREISVRQVRAFQGPNGRPWLVVGCSVQGATSVYDAASGDAAWAQQAQRNRIFEWQTSPAPRWVDTSSQRFTNWSDAAFWEQNTWGVGLGDLNGDGSTDIVFGNYGADFWGAHNQILLWNASAGQFEPLAGQDPFPFLDVSTDVIVADLNGDTIQDIVVANRWRNWGALNGAGNWAILVNSILSGDYVLFGTGTTIVSGSTLPQPTYATRVQIEQALSPSVAADFRDTVALDVGDVDHDGYLDVLAGNHGVPGLPFVQDNMNCDPMVTTPLNLDAVYRLNVPAGFPTNLPFFDPPWDLPATGGDGQLTTDIVFHDVARPVVYGVNSSTGSGVRTYGTWAGSTVGTLTPAFGPTQPGKPWYVFNMVTPPANGDGPWFLNDIRDGWIDITRVARSRAGSNVMHFINDPGRLLPTPHPAFGEVWDGATSSFTTTIPGWGTIPSADPLYGGCFFAMHHSWASPVTYAPAGIGAIAPPNVFGAPNSFAQLMYTNELLDFVNTLVSADFVPDQPFGPSYVSGTDWPGEGKKGYPDLLLGFGYEIAGVPNRLYPFATWQTVQRVAGGDMPGVSWQGGRGGSWTAGWTEKSNKGYGVGLVDMENDGDLDAIATHRTGARLYRNEGPGAPPAGHEGQFSRVTSTQEWPCTDTAYAHSILFREDSCTGDFDNDGDQDVFLVGFAGREDYRNGNPHARGERDEDQNGQSWLHNQAAQDRMLQGTQFLENLTIVAGGTASSGHFAVRSDRCDFNGRVEAEQGGDRAIAADFDGDGFLDMLEPRWLITAPGLPGYEFVGSDPVTAAHWANLDYDYISQHRALLFRYWRNAGNPAGATWFSDDAATLVRCKEVATGTDHFGTYDGRGGLDHGTGTTFAPLHVRVNHGIAAGDFNNDGTVDVAISYSSWPDGARNGYNVFLSDSTGVLWDATITKTQFPPALYPSVVHMLPEWTDPDLAQQPVNGPPPDSFAMASNDYDLDGDVDLFFGFFGWKDMALLENKVIVGFQTQPLPQHPASPTLPSCSFAPRPTSGPQDWVQGELSQMNFPWVGTGHQPEAVFWVLPIDADYDGDQDLISFTGGGSAHLFWMNRVRDPYQPANHFLDRSSDAPYSQDCANPPLPLEILEEMRITSHPGPVPVDLEAGDLNGDSVPDVFAGYTSRPDAPYFGHWEENSPIQANKPYISKVFPEYGVTVGGKFRVYGTQMNLVRRVELVFGPDHQPSAVVTVNPAAGLGTITAGPGARYLDVQLPPGPYSSGAKGPCGVRLIRNGVSSPVWRNTSFTLLL